MSQQESKGQESKEQTANDGFKPDYNIAKLSAWGILGFIIGCVFLFYNDLGTFFTGDSIFHEIKYQPRNYVSLLVNRKIDSLNKEINKTNNEVSKYKNVNVRALTDSAKIKDSLLTKKEYDTTIIKQLSTYQPLCEDISESDTASFNKLNNVLHFQITPGLINEWDSTFIKRAYKWHSHDIKKDSKISFHTIQIDSVKYYLKDSKIPFKMEGTAGIVIEKSKTDIEFITKYPAAGIWLILVFIFCSFCFIAIATSIHNKEKVGEIFNEADKKELSGKYYIISFVIALVIGLMALIWNRSFYDDDIVKNLFFMENLNISTTWVIMLGSITGAFCLAGFIYTASMLSYFAQPLATIRKEVEAQKVVVQKMQTANLSADTSPSEAEQVKLEEKEVKKNEQEIIFNKLTGIFQGYFFLAAIILSLMVLCTGALFSTINSLDFIKLLADDWGYSPVRNDYIYLYGALYTVILLLVYIPAKIRFSEVDIWRKEVVSTPGNTKLSNILKNPFGQIKDVLVATSPFLVSLIQSLFDFLFK